MLIKRGRKGTKGRGREGDKNANIVIKRGKGIKKLKSPTITKGGGKIKEIIEAIEMKKNKSKMKRRRFE